MAEFASPATPRRSSTRRIAAATPWEFGSGGRPRSVRLPGTSAHTWGRREDGSGPSLDCRGDARIPLPVHRSRALFARAWGKDGHPFPVPVRVYDETIRVLKSAVKKAKLGREEELAAVKRLDDQARILERRVSGPSVEQLITEEKASSQSYAGRTVFGTRKPS